MNKQDEVSKIFGFVVGENRSFTILECNSLVKTGHMKLTTDGYELTTQGRQIYRACLIALAKSGYFEE